MKYTNLVEGGSNSEPLRLYVQTSDDQTLPAFVITLKTNGYYDSLVSKFASRALFSKNRTQKAYFLSFRSLYSLLFHCRHFVKSLLHTDELVTDEYIAEVVDNFPSLYQYLLPVDLKTYTHGSND